MCTAITYKTKDHYFGRTLDLEISYGERVLILPRRFRLNFRMSDPIVKHYAMIGMGIEENGYPLFFDATNEKGLSMAGLNFPGNACYYKKEVDCHNVAPFELISWILSQCENIRQATDLLKQTNVVDLSFSDQLPSSPLHWLVADKTGSISVETLKGGMSIMENPVGVLTNNPPFETQCHLLNRYLGLSAGEPSVCFAPNFLLEKYSRGMGAIGLPGDLSSDSRFVRAAFSKLNSVCGDDEMSSVSQFFHILGTVAQIRGCTVLENGEYEITRYTSCCNTDRGLYYFTTYDHAGICCVDLHQMDLESKELVQVGLPKKQEIRVLLP